MNKINRIDYILTGMLVMLTAFAVTVMATTPAIQPI